jgi:hypothetical protein
MGSVIFICPGGRRKVLELQLKYMIKLLDLDIVHEYHLWDFAWTESDSEYIASLKDYHPKLKIMYSPFTKGKRESNIASKQFAYFLHDYYTYEKYKEYIFVKVDDDIVYVDIPQFESFIEGRKNSNSFLYSANVINNNLIEVEKFDFIHSKFLAISHKIVQKNRKKNTEVFPCSNRLSINFVAYLGKDLQFINDEFSDGVGSNDEWRLCNIIPSKLGRDNEICSFMTVVHYNFGGHIPDDFLQSYKDLFEKLHG